MPRKAFIADLQEAMRDFRSEFFSDLKAGEEDGTITFQYHERYGSSGTTIQAIIPEVGDYPMAHQYLLCTSSQQVPSTISLALTDIGTFDGLTISQMLCKVVRKLDEATDPNKMLIDTSEVELETEEEDADENNSDHGSFGGWSPQSPRSNLNTLSNTIGQSSKGFSTSYALHSRIRQDLRLAKEAGFRVGQLGDVFDNRQSFLVTISCRVAKFGISEEALKAWHMDPTQYFIMLIRYSAGYCTLERFTAEEAWAQKTVEMRVGLSQNYKITEAEASSVFSKTRGKENDKDISIYNTFHSPDGLSPLFIGRPLDELLNDRLCILLRYRKDKALSWEGAENLYNSERSGNLDSKSIYQNQPLGNEAKAMENLPPLITADHMTQHASELSFPLVAMQFALRHLVRCTEFCLVCHCKVEEDFEALKPYVCSRPLCLYQYMALGFGPSIEHEIISQPHVVDLLVSFCYSSATAKRLSSLPVGMALAVPPPSLLQRLGKVHPSTSESPGYLPMALNTDMMNITLPELGNRQPKMIHKAKFDRSHMELIFPPGDRTLRPGHWIVFTPPDLPDEQWHCRVIDTLHPTIRLGPPVVRSLKGSRTSLLGPFSNIRDPNDASDANNRPARQRYSKQSNKGSEITPAATPPSPGFPQSSSLSEAEFIMYDENFDDLTDEEKQSSICTLLDTLPSILEMKAFLNSNKGKDATLRVWTDRISPAALGVIRWIIASNRSCIIQVDSIDGDSKRSEERVSGMPQWMQFRFAQGAPDKEQRFINSVRQTSDMIDHPTLFAWHGSPLYNWHSIVREGLHFNHTAHGRAFGHGVYHALDVSTSMSYCAGFGRQYYGNDQVGRAGEWPHSELRISEAIALNEIVNAPRQFVSSSPHLVVAQLDWIQSRYLFVKCNLPGQSIQEKHPTQVYEQDPSWTPLGVGREKIILPITAVSKSRRPGSKVVKTGNKKVRLSTKNAELEVEDLALVSEDTDVDDVAMLLSDTEDIPSKSNQTKGKAKALNAFDPGKSLPTDFVAGVLDFSTLPLLDPPSYATSTATRALQRELANTLQIQENVPAHQLGWYIDPNHVTNVYQWIVELHSFEPHLPLASDLKAKGLKSIVLEIRFGKDYPMSPPFVRVVRPRFLGFMFGGGGHVTAGGAMCMELLTNSGWSAVSNIESVLLQVRLAISSTDPHPARLDTGHAQDYGIGEAVEAFVRACNAHGWTIPADFMSSHSASSSYTKWE